MEYLFLDIEMERKLKNTEEKDYGYDNVPKLWRTNIR